MHFLVTGAAGLIGGAVVKQLVANGHSVVALVRDSTEIRGNCGTLIQTSEFEGKEPSAGEVCIVKGDVGKHDCGLIHQTILALSARVDCVIHCAALVKFEAEYKDLYAVNVVGTRNVARTFPKARLVHVSTAYSCGITDGEIAERPHCDGGRFANGYERSKALAERELLKLRPDAIIARPSIVVGEHENGRIRDFDNIYRVFKFIAEGRIKTIPTTAQATFNFVPIDHVVEGIVALALTDREGPIVAQLAARTAIPAQRFLQLIEDIPGLSCPQIVKPSGAEQFSETGMAQRLVRPYWSYFARSPQFATKVMDTLLGRPSPEMDDAAFLRQIQYCVDAGFIQPRA